MIKLILQLKNLLRNISLRYQIILKAYMIKFKYLFFKNKIYKFKPFRFNIAYYLLRYFDIR